MVRMPAPAENATTRSDSERLSDEIRWTVLRSPRPIARDTAEVVPVPRPIAIPISTITTGNVKLMAASSRVPS